MAMNLEPEKPMESESEVGEEFDEGSSEEVDSEESDCESDNESELTQVAMETSENEVVSGDDGANPSFISGESSIEKTMLKMGKKFFEAGEGIEGENEWKKMKLMECKLNLKLLQVRVAQTKLVLDGLKAENH